MHSLQLGTQVASYPEVRPLGEAAANGSSLSVPLFLAPTSRTVGGGSLAVLQCDRGILLQEAAGDVCQQCIQGKCPPAATLAVIQDTEKCF